MARSFLILTLFFSFLSSSEEFIFWARLAVRDGILIFQNLNISKSMTARSGGEFVYVCDINKTKNEELNTLEFLKNSKDELFDCFVGEAVSIKDEFKNFVFKFSSNTEFIMHPIYFAIDFKPNSATIYKYKKGKR